MSVRKTIAWDARAAVPLLCLALIAPALAGAERLQVAVRNQAGAPVSDAVVYALPLDPTGEYAPLPENVVVDQIDKEYVPYVTAVRVGTRIHFPNHDQIRHHVYSFSEAKTFEIPLYRGTPAKPVVFDKTGDVALGCNIHDWMKAYVFVTETPYFAVTGDDGKANLVAPAGRYAVAVWHPELDGEPEEHDQRASLGAGSAAALHFTIAQRPVWRPRRSPSLLGPGYR